MRDQLLGVWGYSFSPYLLASVPALLPLFWLRVVLFALCGVYQAVVVNRQISLAAGPGESKAALVVRAVVVLLACFVLSYCLCYVYGSGNSDKTIDVVPDIVVDHE